MQDMRRYENCKTIINNMNKQYIKKKLEEHPWGRERSEKDRFLANAIILEYPELQQTALTPIKLGQMFTLYNSADRLWRKILEENENLRGSDYNDKDSLETKKIKELYDILP